MEKLIIKKSEAKNRIDKYLAEKLNISRNQIKKLINNYQILVNKKEISANYKIKENDEILIDKKTEEDEIKQIKKEIKITNKKYDLIDEQKDYLIINKPAGLIVHGGDSVKGMTLVDLLLQDYPELSKIGEDPARPGIVHRLDSAVSGLMIIPRNQDFFDHIKRQFQDRTIKKKYLALVYGEIFKDYDEINFPIKRSSQGFRMAALAPTKKGKKNLDGKRAISDFQVIKRYIGYTLVEVKIKTGRTHQVRVHLAAYGNPIVGDSLYNTKKTREKNEKFNLGRVFLMAEKLKFIDINGKEKKYKIKLPEKLQVFLDKLPNIVNNN